MTEKILICDPDVNFVKKQSQNFIAQNFNPIAVIDGKSAQDESLKNIFNSIVIDIKTAHVSSFDILSYINLNFPATRVFFSYENEEVLEALGINKDNANRLGINKLLKKPYKVETITDYLNKATSPKNSKNTNSESNLTTLKLLDKNFSSTPILDYFSGNISVLDLFIKVTPNKYFKIVHKGDYVSKDQIETLRGEKKIQYLYYRSDDRAAYIEKLNAHLEKYLEVIDPCPKKIIETTQTIIDQYVDEISVKGIDPVILKEGKQLCENIYKSLTYHQFMTDYIDGLKKTNESLSHIFLTGIFSSLITLNIPWASKKTFDYVIQGALLIDVGMAEIPSSISRKKQIEMTLKEKQIYQSHPGKGYDLLSNTNLPQQVKQIVYQHHEWVNGAGYPNGLSGIKIFPLAKIVSFASDFAFYILKNNLSPKEGLIDLLPQKNIISRYDSEVIKSFAMALRKNGGKVEGK